MKKLDLTPLSWLKKEENIDKKFKIEILGIILAYLSIVVIIYNFIVGLIILAVASYIVWNN